MEIAAFSEMLFGRKAEVLPSALYIVATPIGNLKDISFRALEVLAMVDYIAAEDTRNTLKLLNFFNIKKKLISLHKDNEKKRTGELVELLLEGSSIALVSDAGTPLVSDPGYFLLTRAVEAGIPLVPLPGASAAITLFSVSPSLSDAFIFCGFPPKKRSKRQKFLDSFMPLKLPLIFYVSPYFILEFLDELQLYFGDKSAVLGREMTKLHEEFLRGRLSFISSSLRTRELIRGEFCLFLDLSSDSEAEESLDKAVDTEFCEEERLDIFINEGLIRREKTSALAKRLALDLSLDRGFVYSKILEKKKNFN